MTILIVSTLQLHILSPEPAQLLDMYRYNIIKHYCHTSQS